MFVILTSQIFTNPSRSRAQWSFVMSASSTIIYIIMSFPDCNFSIFSLISSRHGSHVAKIARDLERKSLNIVKQKEHLTFSHVLKRAQILPKSLRFNPPVKCREGFKIAKKAGWSFLKLRIQCSHQRIKQLDEQCSDLVRKLSSIITQEHFDALSKVIAHNGRKLKEKVKIKHTRKLTGIGAVMTEDSYVDKNRWVINLSNRQLSEHETSALQNGLNFATTPRVIPTSHIVANIESGIYNLSGSAKATIRASVVNVLKNSKPETTPNITRPQLTAVRTLQQDPTITIVPADKGKAVVVMDTVEYR